MVTGWLVGLGQALGGSGSGDPQNAQFFLRGAQSARAYGAWARAAAHFLVRYLSEDFFSRTAPPPPTPPPIGVPLHMERTPLERPVLRDRSLTETPNRFLSNEDALGA